ncbi:MAG: hypothetical protein HW421_2365 [Ignavibacteria bacterium]|nr:hypothetical protein [Ignavibacteria bacterium]
MDQMIIHFTKKAYKQYKKLPAAYKKLLNAVLEKLQNSVQIDILPVQGETNTYRIRIGKYRIIIIKTNEVILVVKIESRGDVYK